MPTGNHGRASLPSAVKSGLEKVVNTTVAGAQAQALVARLADGGRVVVREGAKIDGWFAASTVNAVVSNGGKALQP